VSSIGITHILFHCDVTGRELTSRPICLTDDNHGKLIALDDNKRPSGFARRYCRRRELSVFSCEVQRRVNHLATCQQSLHHPPSTTRLNSLSLSPLTRTKLNLKYTRHLQLCKLWSRIDGWRNRTDSLIIEVE